MIDNIRINLYNALLSIICSENNGTWKDKFNKQNVLDKISFEEMLTK